MGSVKDLIRLCEPTPVKGGLGIFHFSDRYSVFDWGEMPDHIAHKGEALCVMGAYFFERLEEVGIKTHYVGLLDSFGDVVRLAGLENACCDMKVELVEVRRPTFFEGKYNYSHLTPAGVNFLLPLELIYRRSLPAGSSVFGRLERGELTLNDLGLDHIPVIGEKLARPFLDVSTKLEHTDRYISWSEAARISGISPFLEHDISGMVHLVNSIVEQVACGIGCVYEDGKIELAVNDQLELMVVDIVGGLDECRVTFDGVQLSKEVAREFYRGGEWHTAVGAAKKLAYEKGVRDWKQFCIVQPEPLPVALKNVISQIYMSYANAITGRDFFDTPTLAEVVKEYRSYRG